MPTAGEYKHEPSGIPCHCFVRRRIRHSGCKKSCLRQPQDDQSVCKSKKVTFNPILCIRNYDNNTKSDSEKLCTELQETHRSISQQHQRCKSPPPSSRAGKKTLWNKITSFGIKGTVNTRSGVKLQKVNYSKLPVLHNNAKDANNNVISTINMNHSKQQQSHYHLQFNDSPNFDSNDLNAGTTSSNNNSKILPYDSSSSDSESSYDHSSKQIFNNNNHIGDNMTLTDNSLASSILSHASLSSSNEKRKSNSLMQTFKGNPVTSNSLHDNPSPCYKSSKTRSVAPVLNKNSLTPNQYNEDSMSNYESSNARSFTPTSNEGSLISNRQYTGFSTNPANCVSGIKNDGSTSHLPAFSLSFSRREQSHEDQDSSSSESSDISSLSHSKMSSVSSQHNPLQKPSSCSTTHTSDHSYCDLCQNNRLDSSIDTDSNETRNTVTEAKYVNELARSRDHRSKSLQINLRNSRENSGEYIYSDMNNSRRANYDYINGSQQWTNSEAVESSSSTIPAFPTQSLTQSSAKHKPQVNLGHRIVQDRTSCPGVTSQLGTKLGTTVMNPYRLKFLNKGSRTNLRQDCGDIRMSCFDKADENSYTPNERVVKPFTLSEVLRMTWIILFWTGCAFLIALGYIFVFACSREYD